MLLNVLSRRGDGCGAMQRLIRDSHEADADKTAHRRRAWQLFRSLLARAASSSSIPATRTAASCASMSTAGRLLDGPGAVALPPRDHPAARSRGARLRASTSLTLVEAILENPEIDPPPPARPDQGPADGGDEGRGNGVRPAHGGAREARVPEAAAGVHLRHLQRVRRPAPLGGRGQHPPEVDRPRDVRAVPVVRRIRPDYDLQRVEGLLLRHLNSVYKVLAQTVPDQAKTDDLVEMEDYLRTMLRGVDSSLADEWERMKDPGTSRSGPPAAPRSRAGRPARRTRSRT